MIGDGDCSTVVIGSEDCSRVDVVDDDDESSVVAMFVDDCCSLAAVFLSGVVVTLPDPPLNEEGLGDRGKALVDPDGVAFGVVGEVLVGDLFVASATLPLPCEEAPLSPPLIAARNSGKSRVETEACTCRIGRRLAWRFL